MPIWTTRAPARTSSFRSGVDLAGYGATSGRSTAIGPVTGRPAKRAVATVKTWKILTRQRYFPQHATAIIAAVRVLQSADGRRL
jgi:hypothetical protein